MTTQIEAMKMARTALRQANGHAGDYLKEIHALSAAIEAAEKVEPFVMLSCDGQGYWYPDKEGTKLHLHPSSAEIEELRKDAERLNYLDALCQRKDPNAKEFINQLNSDMHFSKRVVLYVRDICGKVVSSGSGTVREAIDAAMEKQP